jgi:hypothetical protein
LWRAVVEPFDLDQHELALLTALVRQVDRLDVLEGLIETEGVMVRGHGTVKVHPAVVEARQTAIAIARISASLRLPSGEQEDETGRPQRRGAVRGVYQFRPGAA